MELNVSLDFTWYDTTPQDCSVASAALKVGVGKGVPVGVGLGMSNFCPTNNVPQSGGKLFVLPML